MWLPAVGTVVTFKDSDKFTKGHPSWMVLHCSPSLMKFYLAQISSAGYHVTEPLAGSHISVVRREGIPDIGAWRAAIGSRYSFEYCPIVQTNGKHWWLPVRSPALSELRVSFGLPSLPKVPFHLTAAVAAVAEPVQRKRATKEVLAEISLLENMKQALPSWVWDTSPEKLKLELFREKYY